MPRFAATQLEGMASATNRKVGHATERNEARQGGRGTQPYSASPISRTMALAARSAPLSR
jgi:hypothetical protein